MIIKEWDGPATITTVNADHVFLNGYAMRVLGCQCVPGKMYELIMNADGDKWTRHVEDDHQNNGRDVSMELELNGIQIDFYRRIRIVSYEPIGEGHTLIKIKVLA